MADEFQYDVFLSHNAQDKPWVRRLAERLRQAGVRVWFDEWNVGLGDIIALKVDEGLEQSRVLLLCISPHALASGWVALERSTAIHRDPANTGRRFIPPAAGRLRTAGHAPARLCQNSRVVPQTPIAAAEYSHIA
jgi:hypothetical protein